LQTVPIATGGTYKVTIGGAAGTTGGYTVQVTLNAALESESNDGADNARTAEDLNGSFLGLGGSGTDRGAVLGTVSSTTDVRDLYQFGLTAGDPATLALKSLTGGNVDLRLLSGVPSTTRIWDGGSGVDSNWLTAANWLGDLTPLPGDDLIFPSGAARL